MPTTLNFLKFMPQNYINGNVEMEGVFRATYNIFLSSELVTSTES